MTARNWLAANGYEDAATLIDDAAGRIETKGKKSRRNWWDTLAGGANGMPLTREGITFPVLRVAQIRQGKPVTPNALCRDENEAPPAAISTERWPRRRLPSRAAQPTKAGRIGKRPVAKAS